MKNFSFLTYLVLIGSLTANGQTSAPADEEAIKSLIAEFSSAFNAHDPKLFATKFTEDADFTNWLGTGQHGRAEIEAGHVKVLTVMYKNAVQKVTDSKVRFIKPDVAVVDVRAEVIGGMTPDGKDAPVMKFLLNWTVTKEVSGQWLIKVMHNTRLP